MTMQTMRVILCAVLALAGVGHAVGADASPEAVVRVTSDRVLVLIEEGKTYVQKDPDRFYRAVHDVLEPVVAFDAFARGVMGPYWREATDAQRTRFIETFKWGLLRTYSAALTEFSDGEVVVLDPDKPPRVPDRREVRMEIRTSKGDVYPVLYSMALDDQARWRVRNLVVGGVNIGLTYQNQFKSAMRDARYGGSMDRVIDSWATVVEAEKSKTTSEVSQAAPANAG
jgi:phospholipid transport system substrate-binding protein